MSFSSVTGEVMVEAEKIAASGNYRVNFSLKADRCAAVSLVGSFNDWDTGVLPMKWSEAEAVFVCRLELAPGYYEYKFIVDGAWVLDESNPNFSANDFGTLNSVINLQ